MRITVLTVLSVLSSLLVLAGCIARGATVAPAGTPGSTAYVPPPLPAYSPMPATEVPGKPTPLPPPTNPPGPMAARIITPAVAYLPPAPDFRSVTFVDVQHGWSLSKTNDISGTMLSTTLLATVDGGYTWRTRAVLAPGISMPDFVSPDRGWAAATDGQLLATTDGGSTWTPVAVPGLAHVDAVDFVDSARGWAAAAWRHDMPSLTFARTADGGATWTLHAVELPEPPDTSYPLYSYSIASTGAVYALAFQMGGTQCQGARAQLYKSSDDGQTWTLTPDPERQSPTAYPPPVTPAPFLGLPGDCLGPPIFYDDQHGWLGASHAGLYATTDGGQTWSNITPPSYIPYADCCLSGLKLIGPGAGFVQHSHGGLIMTVDNGAHWSAVYPQGATWGPLWIFSPREALGIGNYLEGGAVFRTADSGHTWQQVSTLPADNGLYTYNALWFADEQIGVASASHGDAFITHDGGVTFTPLDGTPGPGDYQALASGVDYAAPDDAWKAVNGELQATTDNGIIWQPIPLGYRIRGFDHVPGGGWVVAGDCRGTWPCQDVLLSTADGGATWTRYALGDIGIEHVLATSTQRAWFTDGAGHWYATEDGGVAWRQWR